MLASGRGEAQVNPLLKSERHKRIRRLIEDNGQATVAELSVIFGVSEATIRRDLEELNKLGWVQREHGVIGVVGPVRHIPGMLLDWLQNSSLQ